MGPCWRTRPLSPTRTLSRSLVVEAQRWGRAPRVRSEAALTPRPRSTSASLCPAFRKVNRSSTPMRPRSSRRCAEVKTKELTKVPLHPHPANTSATCPRNPMACTPTPLGWGLHISPRGSARCCPRSRHPLFALVVSWGSPPFPPPSCRSTRPVPIIYPMTFSSGQNHQRPRPHQRSRGWDWDWDWGIIKASTANTIQQLTTWRVGANFSRCFSRPVHHGWLQWNIGLPVLWLAGTVGA